MALLAEKPLSGQEIKINDLFLADLFLADLSCNIFSTEDDAAADIAKDSTAMFAWQVEFLQEYSSCTERALLWGPGGGPDIIVDEGGDATLLIHKGFKAKEEFAQSGKLPDLGAITNQMQARGTLLIPTFNVNDSVTKRKWDDLNCLIGVKYVMIADKVGLRCGYGDVGKPFCAVKSVMEALPEDVFGTADIFVHQYMRKMKNNAIVCIIGHFDNYFSMQFSFFYNLN